MKKIYRRASSLIGRLCAIGLAIMGYGCENDADMYGTPTGHFEIKGTVMKAKSEISSSTAVPE